MTMSIIPPSSLLSGSGLCKTRLLSRIGPYFIACVNGVLISHGDGRIPQPTHGGRLEISIVSRNTVATLTCPQLTICHIAEWIRIAQILNFNSFLGEWDDFWGHNDPDMLEIGNGNLTVEERRSHFAFWAIMKSPLLIGTNLVNITKENADILQNKHLLAFNQDPEMGKPAQPYKWFVDSTL